MNIPVPPPMKSHTTIPAPPIPGFMPAPDGAMTIKRKHVTKYKLPTLNWMPLKPNQVQYISIAQTPNEILNALIVYFIEL